MTARQDRGTRWPRRGPQRPARPLGARWHRQSSPGPVGGPACPHRPPAPGCAAARPSPASCYPRFCWSASSGCCPWRAARRCARLPPAPRSLWEVYAGSECLHHQEELPRRPRGCPAQRRGVGYRGGSPASAALSGGVGQLPALPGPVSPEFTPETSRSRAPGASWADRSQPLI